MSKPHKRQRESDDEEQQPPSKKSKGEVDDKFPHKRRSDERRKNTIFMGVCLTCNEYYGSTIGEVSSFAFEHMCYTDGGRKSDGLEQCIQFLKSQRKSIRKEEKTAPEDSTNSSEGQEKKD